jgi:hypothetical protein
MYHDLMSGETSRVYMWEMCRILADAESREA